MKSIQFPYDWCGTLFWTEKFLNYYHFTDIVREIMDFEFLDASLGVIFDPLLEKIQLWNCFKILDTVKAAF